MEVPAKTPVTIPVVLPIVAELPAAVHVPPAVASVKVIVAPPAHTVDKPLIGEGKGLTVN